MVQTNLIECILDKNCNVLNQKCKIVFFQKVRLNRHYEKHQLGGNSF